jgi:hypothetical protein
MFHDSEGHFASSYHLTYQQNAQLFAFAVGGPLSQLSAGGLLPPVINQFFGQKILTPMS